MRPSRWLAALVVLAAAAAAILVLILDEDIQPPPREVRGGYVPPPRVRRDLPPVPFTDVTAETALASYDHVTGGFRTDDGGESRYLPECMGGGVVLFDPDGDGDQDLLLVNSTWFEGHEGSGPPPTSRLYRNDGDLRFTDVSETSGLAVSCYGMGGAAADYDGDGLQDVLITSWGGLRLFRNLGGLRFREVTDEAGLRTDGWRDARGRSGPDWFTGAAFFDADGDADLDLFAVGYVRWTPEIDVYFTFDGKRKSFTVPTRYEGNTCHLFLNGGDGRFTDVTEESGIEVPQAKSLAVALWDFDDNGLLDLVVANDQAPNLYFVNLGGGRFEERAAEAGIDYDENGMVRAGMGIDAADYLNDGVPGVPIGNFSREPVALYRQVAPGFFRDVTQQAGIAAVSQTELTFGLAFADFDLDGLQDLVCANGHLEPHIQDVQSEIPYAQPPLLLRNQGDGSFAKWNDEAGRPFRTPLVGRGLAVADLDRDGDVDVVITTNDGPVHVLRNDLPRERRRSLRVRLAGAPPNTDAVGAWITVRAGDTVQRRLVRTGSSYLSQSELPQTFGLGGAEKADVVTVRWPDGSETERRDVPVGGAELVIRQE